MTLTASQNPVPKGPNRKVGWWDHLGPGVILAATSVGASHLVMAPQAGALFGYQLVWLVVFAHLFKYPAFEFGPRYAAATGRSLLDGYSRLRGQWPLYPFLITTVLQGIGVLAGVVGIGGAVAGSLLRAPVSSLPWLDLILVCVILGLLALGGFRWLDSLNKIMMATLGVATLLAFVPVVPGPEVLAQALVPGIPAGSIALVAAILGWMPTGIDVSIWHSFWTVEKVRQLHPDAGGAGRDERKRIVRLSMIDMRTGYLFSCGTGIVFVLLGAILLAGKGQMLQGAQFAETLSEAYTHIWGRWMYYVFMVGAFFALFSTSYAVMDGFSRSFSEAVGLLWTAARGTAVRRKLYFGFAGASSGLALVTIFTVGNPVTLATGVAILTLAASPLLYALNLHCVRTQIDDRDLRPSGPLVAGSVAGIVLMTVTVFLYGYIQLQSLGIIP